MQLAALNMERLPQYDAFPIAVADIYCDSGFNCRGIIDPQSVAELADDIKARGLTDPIDVQPACDVIGGLPPGYKFRCLAGHRRYEAVTRFLGWTSIPAKVRSGLDECKARIFNFNENDKRTNLNPLQEALALREIIRCYPPGTLKKQIWGDLKKSNRWFQHRVEMLELPEEVQEMIAAGRVKLYDIEIIRRHHEPETQIRVATEIADCKRGRGRKREIKNPELVRTFKRHRGKQEINALIQRCLEAGVVLDGNRCLAWAAGSLTDAEIEKDFDIQIRRRNVKE